MSYEHLVPGLQVELTIPDIDRVRIKNKIVEISTDYIKFYSLTEKGYPLRIAEETKVYVTFIKGSTKFRFTTTVLDNQLEPIAALVVKPPEVMHKVQLREFYRLPKLLSVVFKTEDGAAYEGYTVNISAGGILLATQAILQYEQELSLSIVLDDNELLEAVGNVIRIGSKDELTNLYGISFIDLPRDKQKQLIKYIFQVQIEMRRKGLL